VSSLNLQFEARALEQPNSVAALVQRKRFRARARVAGSAPPPREVASALLAAARPGAGAKVTADTASLRRILIEPALTARKAGLRFSSAT